MMLRLIFLLSLCLNLSACVQSPKKTILPAELSSEIRAAYEAGQAILLYRFDPLGFDSEAYADWHAYLTDFKKAEGNEFFTQEIDATVLQKLVPDSKEEIDFSLFIKKGQPSYLYPDVILEPQIYLAVFHVYSGNATTDEDAAFMPPKVDLLSN